MARLTSLVLAGMLGLSACAPAPTDAPTALGLRTDDVGNPVDAEDARPLGRLTELDACGAPPAPGPDPVPEGLFLPPGTIVTSVEAIDPVISVEAWAPLTPSQIRRSYENAAGYEMLTREDESFDAEVLITDGDQRSFVEMLAICDQASRFIVVTSAEDGA